jgi:hypothetical protein
MRRADFSSFAIPSPSPPITDARYGIMG